MDLNAGQAAAFTGISDAVSDNDGLNILLQGPAGTGKTAVLGRILQDFIKNVPGATNPGVDQWGRQLPGKLCVAAMSHKAKGEVAASLAKYGVVDHPIITCDQLLKARPVTDPQTRQKVTMRQQVPLEASYQFIVIDEVSMMSEQYFQWLLQWKNDWQTILFLGDRAQLPPVADGKLCSAFTDCDLTFNLTEVMRHDGCILDACKKVRTWGVGYPSLKAAQDDDGEVVVYGNKKEYLEALYAAAEADPHLKVVCHTNRNVHMVNNEIHKRRNPGVEVPFVQGEHVMAARAVEDPCGSHPLVPSSMDMTVLGCEPVRLNLGLQVADHILGMQAVRALLGTDGDEDIYRCHKVYADFGGKDVDFFVFNNHQGEKKNFDATQEYLKGFADDLSRDESIRKALNQFILWREKHFASVHLSTAMTIHKSQGSSFDRVWVFPDIPKRNNKASNALAYVAVSRAKKQLVVCN